MIWKSGPSVGYTIFYTGRVAMDLGAGSGAFAVRIQRLGYQVIAVDIDPSGFKADVLLD